MASATGSGPRARPPSSQYRGDRAVPGAVDQAADHRAGAPDGQHPADVLRASIARSVATMATSQPPRTMVVAAAAARTVNTGGPNHERRGGGATSASWSPAARSAGLMMNSTRPAMIDSHSNTKIEMAVSPDRRHPDPERRARHERELGTDRVERQGRAALLLGDRHDEDLAHDRERRHREQPAERGQAHQPPVVDPRRDRPADRLTSSEGRTTRRRPLRSRSRPRHGPETASASVAAVARIPAAP